MQDEDDSDVIEVQSLGKGKKEVILINGSETLHRTDPISDDDFNSMDNLDMYDIRLLSNALVRTDTALRNCQTVEALAAMSKTTIDLVKARREIVKEYATRKAKNADPWSKV